MYTWQELFSLYHLSVPAMTNLQPRYNICPTDTIDVVVRGGADRRRCSPALARIQAGEQLAR
jgi:putative SOS response-associated peptidase YedK